MESCFLKDRSGNIIAVVCVAESRDIHCGVDAVLSSFELGKYESFKKSSSREGFLLGRYAAKLSYIKMNSQLCHGIGLNEIEIRNGIFGQPFFAVGSKFDVSISHTKGVGGAVVFDVAYPMGVDVELTDKSTCEIIQEAIDFVGNEQFGIARTKEDLVSFWSLKEALAKALKTGLTMPLSFMDLEILPETYDGISFLCEFKNFPQYVGMAKILRGFVMALVYPRQICILGG